MLKKSSKEQEDKFTSKCLLKTVDTEPLLKIHKDLLQHKKAT